MNDIKIKNKIMELNDMTLFKKTDLEFDTLTKWILEKYKKYKITEIRYFGSRVYGSPRDNSDIDVYILFDKKSPDKPPVWTELYNNFQIEFHGFMDFHDGYVPTYLVGDKCENQIKN